MSFRQRCLSATEGFLDRLLCVAGAMVFSQAPEFMQQYLQRLGGHLDEARRQLAQFEDIATQSGLTLARLIAQTSADRDAATARLGGVMRDSLARVSELQSAHDSLAHASLVERPFVFLRHADLGIVEGTWHVFQPAVPTTVEGLVYALAGMLVLLALYHGGVKAGGRALWRLWQRGGSAPSAAGATPGR